MRPDPSRAPYVRKNHKVAAVLAAAVAMAAASAAGAVTVQIDQSTLVDLGAPAGNVVIGNPTVVDVSLITPRKIAILGRGYGVTNVIITDRMGRTIFQQQVNVTPVESGRVSVYRGTLVHNFACSPRCERTPMPGEEKTSVYEPFAQAYKEYSERAKSESGPAAP